MARVHTGESVLARTVRIVESFRSDDSLLTVSEIARRSGLHISTTSRLIDELVGCGWLEREDRKVRIGVRLWEVASRASPTLGLREAAMPFMEDLHAVVGQHTQLGVLEGDEVLFIERLTAPGAVVNYTRIAGRMPLHVSSSGLVLLAHGPSELQERILSEPLKVYTDNTIRTARQLRGVLADVRRHGYILCAGHLYPDTTGVAVPVRDGSGKVAAALSVIVPNDEKAYAQIPALQAAAKGITRVMAAAPK
ncbi:MULTISPECIES: IclR family transcriptional regulator [Rhodococcus]|uniref:IclR family transcriptional regulator n=1 Tax=Rhodococcus TaxID=1827 RepID=UPI00046CD32F|nr:MULTISPECIES: IclR family transcriptional regulator [Rhodococcus]PBC56343.1 IclR family transcriptional regulator [Rhodococcus sp. ACPA1]UDG96537.1 IclR family transcriptional regulator [Rhodococcus opacus PD630]